MKNAVKGPWKQEQEQKVGEGESEQPVYQENRDPDLKTT